MFMAKNQHETSSMDKNQFLEEKNNLQFRIEKKNQHYAKSTNEISAQQVL